MQPQEVSPRGADLPARRRELLQQREGTRRGDPRTAGTSASGGDCKCSTITAIAEEWMIPPPSPPLTALEKLQRQWRFAWKVQEICHAAQFKTHFNPFESLCEVDRCAISGSLPFSAPSPESWGPSVCWVLMCFSSTVWKEETPRDEDGHFNTH